MFQVYFCDPMFKDLLGDCQLDRCFYHFKEKNLRMGQNRFCSSLLTTTIKTVQKRSWNGWKPSKYTRLHYKTIKKKTLIIKKPFKTIETPFYIKKKKKTLIKNFIKPPSFFDPTSAPRLARPSPLRKLGELMPLGARGEGEKGMSLKAGRGLESKPSVFHRKKEAQKGKGKGRKATKKRIGKKWRGVKKTKTPVVLGDKKRLKRRKNMKDCWLKRYEKVWFSRGKWRAMSYLAS